MDETWEVKPDSDLASMLAHLPAGDQMSLTREGQVVAYVTSVPAVAKPAPLSLEELRALRDKLDLRAGMSLRELAHEGHKY